MVTRLDWLVVAVVGVLGQLDVWYFGNLDRSMLGAVILAASAIALLFRRLRPITVALIVLALQAALAAVMKPDALTFGVIEICAWYAVGRWANPKRGLIALIVVTVLSVFAVDPQHNIADWINLFLAISLTSFVAPWLVGFVVRQRSDHRDREAYLLVQSEPLIGHAPLSTGLFDTLTPREREVFGLIAYGKTNSEIADELVLSIYTVKAHVASILTKLDLRDRVQVVVFAYETGLVQPRTATLRD